MCGQACGLRLALEMQASATTEADGFRERNMESRTPSSAGRTTAMLARVRVKRAVYG